MSDTDTREKVVIHPWHQQSRALQPRWAITEYQRKALDDFCTMLKKHALLHSAEVLVFGSAARGRTLPFSDIDVAVVSSSFSSIPWSQRLKELKALLPAGSLISPIGVTTAELGRGPHAYPSVLRSLTTHQCKTAREILESD